MPSQHRETLFLERRAPSLLVVTCLIVVREIARAAARSRELVERVRRASSRFARAVTVYTYTRIRIRIKRFTVYTVASFWRTRAEPNPPQPAAARPPPYVPTHLFIFLSRSTDEQTLWDFHSPCPANELFPPFLLPSSFAYFSSAILFLSRREPGRRAATCDSAVPADFLITAFANRLYRALSMVSACEQKGCLSARKSKYVIRISLWREQRREPGKPGIGELETRGFSFAILDFGISSFLLSGFRARGRRVA